MLNAVKRSIEEDREVAFGFDNMDVVRDIILSSISGSETRIYWVKGLWNFPVQHGG